MRRYQPGDCKMLGQLFYDTVHSVNCRDYTPQQLHVWATGNMDGERWNQSFLEHYTLVAVEGETIVGFGDIDDTGYLDRLYVHRDYQGRGIATAICNELEQAVGSPKIVTHASITAKPFFEKRGYRVVKQQQVERQGVVLINYWMEKYK